MRYQQSYDAISDAATVLATVASGFAAFTDQQGVDVAEIFDRSALNPEILNDPNRPIALSGFLNALDTASDITQNENFGLWLGHQFRPEYLGLWGYIGLSSATLGDALGNMVSCFPYFQRKSALRLTPYRGKVRLEYRLYDGAIISRRHDAELTLGVLCNVIKRALGDQWAPVEVHFTHAIPEGWHEHERAFGCEVRFNQEVNGIVLQPTEFVRVMPGADHQLLMVMQQSLKLLHDSNAIPASVTDKVRAEIVELMYHGCPRLEDVAVRLGIPAWTLSRQLKDEHQNFSSLVELVRQDMACHYLRHTRLSVSAVAYTLGYTETSSFSHAFQRWFGVSPRHWRERERLQALSVRGR